MRVKVRGSVRVKVRGKCEGQSQGQGSVRVAFDNIEVAQYVPRSRSCGKNMEDHVMVTWRIM